MEEIAFMVCARADELDDPVEGSTKTACVECGCDVWISAESRKEMSRVKGMPLCFRCADRMAQEHPTEMRTVGEPSDGQFEEIIKDLRHNPKFKPEWEGVLNGDDMDAYDALKITATMSTELFTSPDDDWGHVCILEGWDGHTFPPLPLHQMMEAGLPKEMLARQLIPGLVHASNAKRVLFGLSAWTVSGEGALDEGPPSEHPLREEALFLMEVTADGVQRMSSAKIHRDGISAPTLGEWMETEKPDKSDGLFVDALVPALQLVRKLREES